MTAAIGIVQSGPGNTIQDAGRFGWLRYGVTPAGPMDPVAFEIANALAGNPAGAAAIEVSIGGLAIEAAGASFTVGYAGAPFAFQLGATVLPACGRLRLDPGDRLSVRAGPAGMWAYLALAGELNLPAVMGSRATHTRSGLGGLDGRMLRAGDRIGVSRARVLPPAGFDRPAFDRAAGVAGPAGAFRVVPGPQDDYFTAEAIETFFAATFTLTAQMDRMAYRLAGPPIAHAKGFNITSDGIALGAIQIPGGGFPLVLMADRQPTGGYPKLGTVLSADLPRLAQLRAGESLRFARSDPATGAAALRAIHTALDGFETFVTSVATAPDTGRLLESNLIGGVVDADPLNLDP